MRLGEHSLSRLDWTEQIRRSGFSVTHPGYQGTQHNHDNDLRLLRLGTPVRLTRSVQLLPLPTTCAAAGTECQISGWGITNQPQGKGASGSGLRTGKVWGGGGEIRSQNISAEGWIKVKYEDWDLGLEIMADQGSWESKWLTGWVWSRSEAVGQGGD